MRQWTTPPSASHNYRHTCMCGIWRLRILKVPGHQQLLQVCECVHFCLPQRLIPTVCNFPSSIQPYSQLISQPFLPSFVPRLSLPASFPGSLSQPRFQLLHLPQPKSPVTSSQFLPPSYIPNLFPLTYFEPHSSLILAFPS